MQELVICRGIPACGKSTYAAKWVGDDENRVRVNRDDIRFLMYGTYFGPPIDEAVVTAVEDAAIAASLDAGCSVIVDDTNIDLAFLGRIAKIGLKRKLNVEVVTFDIELEEALRRNRLRDRKVPENVIQMMYDDLRRFAWT